MNNEQLYNNIWEKAYCTAFAIINNATDAEDIAQVSTIKFYLKKATIEKPLSWIVIVAKHEAIKKKEEKSKILQLKNKEIIADKLAIKEPNLDDYIDANNETVENLNVSDQEAKKLLSVEDYKIFRLWEKFNFDIKKIAKIKKISNKQATEIVYRMKRNLRAAKLQKEGYIGTKKIIDYNLNKKIIYFIKKFTEKMKANKINALHSYLELYNDPIPKLDIYKYYDYQIRKIDTNIFSLSVPYKTSENKIRVFTVNFLLNKKNAIKIIKFYSPSRTGYKVKLSKEEFLKRLKPLKKGVHQESYEEIIEKLKGHLEKLD